MNDNRDQRRERIAAEIDRRRAAASEAWGDELSSAELADAVLAVEPEIRAAQAAALSPDPEPAILEMLTLQRYFESLARAARHAAPNAYDNGQVAAYSEAAEQISEARGRLADRASAVRDTQDAD